MRKKTTFTLLGVALLGTLVVAQVAPQLLRELRFRTVPNANLNASEIRVTSGELGLNRVASFNVELLNTNRAIVDRVTITLTRPELRQWFAATNPAVVLRGLLISKLSVAADQTETPADPAE